MRRGSLLATIATIAVAACTSVSPTAPVSWSMKVPSKADVASREIIIGRWYEETTASDGSKMAELSERRRDGTYQATFRKITPSGHVVDQTEVGLWGVSGKVYFQIMQGYLENGTVHSVSPTDADYYDAYEIVKLTLQVFECIHSATREHYIAKKVAQSFRLPDEI